MSKESEDITSQKCKFFRADISTVGGMNLPPTIQESLKFHVFAELYLHWLSTNRFPVCRESHVRQPGTSGFCYRANVFFVLNLPNRQVLFLGEIQITEGLLSILPIKKGLGATAVVEMTCGLVHAIYSLPEWQAVKLTFFAPCFHTWQVY